MPQPSRLPDYQHQTIATSSVPIRLVELPGTGPALLLIHGIGMDWRVWQAVARRLHPHFHLYFLDLRGHGSSGKPANGYTLAHYAADVEDVIDAVGLTDLTIAGSSLGAMVAVSIEAPIDVVGHRVLVDPPLTGGPIRDVAMFSEILRRKQGATSELTAYLGRLNPGVGAHYLRTMAGMWQESADGVLTDALASAHDYFAIDDHLRYVDSPTLILQADRERGGVLADEQASRAVALLPRGTWIKVPGAGHAIHATRPDEFVRQLVEFTRSNRPSSSGLE